MDTATTKIASATEPQSRAGASPDFRASSSNSDRLPLARTDSGGLLSPTSESSRSRPSSQGSLSRNQAPGILDRRRSVRPSSTNRGSLCVGDADKSRKRRSVGPILPVKISNMADFQNELKVDGGSRPVTPGDTEDTFEDAAESTPKPPATEQDTAADGGAEKGIEGTQITGQSDGADDQVIRKSTSDNAPTLAPSPAIAEGRERSVSPSKTPSGQSPARGLPGDIPILSPPADEERPSNMQQRASTERVNSMSPPRGGLARASSGLSGLLGRMGSIRKSARSPDASKPIGERRRMTPSVDSKGLAAIADGCEDESGMKPSLQDQFQSLRRQEEHRTPGVDGHQVIGNEEATTERSPSDAGSASPPSPRKGSMSTRTHRPSVSSTSGLKSPPLNPKLPPGTASGLTAGPTEEPRPVDWDLWQAVVCEGPSAVQKTSGEELKQAIASGIPPAIRGVVWQVLADSKNEELEQIYRTLKARGTVDAVESTSEQRPTPPSRAGSHNVGAGEKPEKGSQNNSSRSSVHSQHSTPATSTKASPPQSLNTDDAELKAKLLAEKQKRDAAALTQLEKTIKRDLGSRTSYSKFTQSAGLQDGLFGVCKAYALFDEGVGYAQGMNFIAMPLLFNMNEEEAFTLLVRLMSKYDVRSMFTADMAGLHLRLHQFERLLEDHDPALYCHLRRRNVTPQLYATQWFLTLFAYRFPLQLVLRVYDLIFSQGLTAILKFGIVLMKRNRDILLETKDMSQLTAHLKEKIFDVYIDKSPSASSLLDSGFFGSVTGGADKELYRADELVRDACDVHIPDATLAQYTAEWEETQRATQERETEIDNLRAASASLTARVKQLEDRTQEQDAEHVTITHDLVKHKVENDALQDQNEGLKIQVQALQSMVDAQPAEVEEKLKEEMERIMGRNVEVQNENRGLKEEMDEMEAALVDAKMRHAQIQADHDTLKQKWASVQNMLKDQS